MLRTRLPPYRTSPTPTPTPTSRHAGIVKTRGGKQAVHVRVGINSGSVVSGVVGRKKQQFSLFGDCVNTASRMQSCAGPDEIRVSKRTMDFLRDDVNAAHYEVFIKVGDGLGEGVCPGGRGGSGRGR